MGLNAPMDVRYDADRPAGPAAARRLPRRIPGRVESSRRPGPVRPAATPLRYHGNGVRLSTVRGPRRHRAITPAATVGLALLAALITVWLGLVAQFGESVRGASGPVPDRLMVVQVHAGESLHQVAARVAPDAPVGTVAERIRELNRLESPALDAGQTLIAPVG